MEIEYRLGYQRRNLIIGFLWLVIFFLAAISNEGPSLLDFLWLFLAISFCGTFLYQRRFKYILINDGLLRIAGPLGRKIQLKDIKQVNRRMRRIDIMTDTMKLSINTEIIDRNSISDLEKELKKWSSVQLPREH